MKQEKKDSKNKKRNIKKYLYLIPIIVLLIIFGVWIWIVNRNARSLNKYSEITFVSPTQAIIFWKSEKETLGYIKYGDSKFRLKNTEIQTSSEPNTIHVVFLENIPLEGIYISKRNEKDNIFIFPYIEYIKYDTNQLDEQ